MIKQAAALLFTPDEAERSTSQPINQILKCVVVDSFHKMMSDTLKHMMTSYLCNCVIPQLITANRRHLCC